MLHYNRAMGEDDAAPENQDVSALTEDTIRSMRQAGEKKPDNVTWSQWKSTKKFTPKHSMVSHLAAIGLKNIDIARETGLSASYISTLINDPKVRNEIKYLQNQMFGSDPRKRFQSLFTESVETVEEVMRDKAEKGATRLMAAQIVQERVLGRPTQEVEIGGSLIRMLFEKLDQKDKDRKMMDVTPKIERPMLLIEGESGDNDRGMGTMFEPESAHPEDFLEIEKKEEPVSEVDSWIEQNLGVKPK